jgi:hypothetical protein
VNTAAMECWGGAASNGKVFEADVVLLYPNRSGDSLSMHESAALEKIAEKLAGLKGYTFAGWYDPDVLYQGRIYFLPTSTVAGFEVARQLGIRHEDDLFGGVVPHGFVATKTIAHPLVHPGACGPSGWSGEFARRVGEVTLFGFSAFTANDAYRAGELVLQRGPARIKPANGVGGRGQKVARDLDELESALAIMGEGAISNLGVVIEENLDQVVTFSVGQVRLSDYRVTYCGRQRLTKDNQGAQVYGGSDLFFVRGDYDRLLRASLSPRARLAVVQARVYDAAAEEFRGLIASRRNYDVAQGFVAQTHRRSGVLEHSWRVGGASTAEIAALEAFSEDETLQTVGASSFEVYGTHEPPANATLYFRGVDDRVGAITKYTVLDRDADCP